MDDSNRKVTDWELCVICQESNKEGLQCPADSRRADKGAGYKTLADNLKQFADLGYMPKDVNLSRLDEGDGIAAAFFKHRARYHKSCYALFNLTKRKQAQKRKSEAPDEPLAGGKFTRSNALAYTKDTSPSCFLCESHKQPLHRVPQGNILGPLLFVIYINDLPSILECCCASLYADDTVIYCYGSSSQELSDKLNRDLLAVAKWLNDHKLTLNLEKTKCMLVGSNRKLESKMALTVSIFDHNVNNINSFKYLEILISSDFSGAPCMRERSTITKIIW